MKKLKEIALWVVVICFSLYLVVDIYQERNNAITKDEQKTSLLYSQTFHSNYSYIKEDPLDKLKQFSQNTTLSPGTYEVSEDEDQKNTIKPGVYVFKNEDYNNKAKLIVNDNEYILGNLLDKNIHINYVELNLQVGDKVVVKNKLSLKKTNIIKEQNE